MQKREKGRKGKKQRGGEGRVGEGKTRNIEKWRKGGGRSGIRDGGNIR